MKKKSLAIILVMTMVFSLWGPISSPMAGIRAEAADSTVTSSVGDFYYGSEEYFSKDYKATYYYSDSYFAASSYEYQADLATMSMCLSMAAFRSNRTSDYAKKSQNLQALLKECGFTDFAANSDYKSTPTRNSTGVGCAHKKINVNGETYTLVALAVCGGRHEAEWGGSFEVGTSGSLYNAREGADTTLDFLKKYISDQGITGNIKLWMTGYMLGAGRVNLVAGDLDDGTSLGSNVTLEKENMYAYCLQCPRVALTSYGLDDAAYKNIFCINNPYNIGTKMAPSEYGFGTYGVNKNYPTEHGDSQYSRKRNAMLKKLNELDGAAEYILDDFQMKEISILGDGFVGDDNDTDWDQDEFAEQFVSDIVDSCANTRKDYVTNFQDDVSDLLELAFGNPDEKWPNCMDIFMDEVQDNILTIGLNIVLANESKLADIYEEHAYNALDKSGITAFTDSDVSKFAKVMAKLSVQFGREHPNLSVTLLANIDCLFRANNVTINLAWLMSEDDNYNGTGRDITKCSASLSKTSYDYNGKARKPSVIVKNGSVTLTKGTDYTVVYSDNKNAGTAKVTIEGKGIYSGTIEKTFKINKVSNTITASKFKKTYSTKDQSFSLDAECKGGAKLSYKSNNSKITVNSSGKVTIKSKYIGKATITITSAESKNYLKTKTKITVTVNPTKTTLSSVSSAKSNQATVKWKKNSSAGGYQIYLSTEKDFSSDTKSTKVKKSATSVTIKGLSGNETYYFKIRAYKTVDEKTYYGAWSSIKSIKVKK